MGNICRGIRSIAGVIGAKLIEGCLEDSSNESLIVEQAKRELTDGIKKYDVSKEKEDVYEKIEKGITEQFKA